MPMIHISHAFSPFFYLQNIYFIRYSNKPTCRTMKQLHFNYGGQRTFLGIFCPFIDGQPNSFRSTYFGSWSLIVARYFVLLHDLASGILSVTLSPNHISTNEPIFHINHKSSNHSYNARFHV